MSIDLQLISFLYFSIFGLLIEIIYELILKRHKKLCYIVNAILTLVFMYFLYQLNNGKIHIYFIIIFLISILLSKICVKFTKKYLQLLAKKKVL